MVYHKRRKQTDFNDMIRDYFFKLLIWYMQLSKPKIHRKAWNKICPECHGLMFMMTKDKEWDCTCGCRLNKTEMEKL